jgi:hypothetical protein
MVNLNSDAKVLHLRIVESFIHGVDRSAWHADRIQLLDPFRSRAGTKMFCDSFIHSIAIAASIIRRCETFPVSEGFITKRPAQLDPSALRTRPDV